MLWGLWIRGVFVWSWGRDLDFLPIRGRSLTWTRCSMCILYRIEAYQFHMDETLGGYMLMEGNVAGPWLAATGCVVPDAQEQKPSTKPWMLRQKERYNALGILRIALVFTFRVVAFCGLLCYENWLVNICKPMEMPTVSSSHVRRQHGSSI